MIGGIGIITHSLVLSNSYEKLNPNDGWITTKIFCKGKEKLNKILFDFQALDVIVRSGYYDYIVKKFCSL